METEVITVATDPERREGELVPLRLLSRSCHRLGLPLTVLGAGSPWRGYGTKLRLVRNHLAGRPGDAIVVFVDAYDSLLLPSGDRLRERFLALEAPLVFSAERGCWPDPERASLYPSMDPGGRAAATGFPAAPHPFPPTRSPFRFLNSGGYMGYVEAIAAALDQLAPQEHEDDQRLLTDYLLRNPGRVRLDREAVIFQTLYQVGPEDFDLAGTSPLRLRSRLTGSEPCVLHGNGPGFSTFASLAERLRFSDWP